LKQSAAKRVAKAVFGLNVFGFCGMKETYRGQQEKGHGQGIHD
jgi:hypothetical protein